MRPAGVGRPLPGEDLPEGAGPEVLDLPLQVHRRPAARVPAAPPAPVQPADLALAGVVPLLLGAGDLVAPGAIAGGGVCSCADPSCPGPAAMR
jgi:hypothetical protein